MGENIHKIIHPVALSHQGERSGVNQKVIKGRNVTEFLPVTLFLKYEDPLLEQNHFPAVQERTALTVLFAFFYDVNSFQINLQLQHQRETTFLKINKSI